MKKTKSKKLSHHPDHDCEREMKENLKKSVHDLILKIFEHIDSIHDYREYHLSFYFALQDLLSHFKKKFLSNEIKIEMKERKNKK